MTYETIKESITSDFDFSQFSDFNHVRDSIVYRVIFYETNKEMLENVPHIRYLDLAVIFCYLIAKDDEATATVRITNAHALMWSVSAEDLFAFANENTPRLMPYKFKNMYNMLEELSRRDDEILPFPEDLSYPMFVLTNDSGLHGAACLLYDGLLNHIYKKLGEDYYVLPSSIHEVIIVPCSFSDDIDTLNSMIKEVNATQVSPPEVLSDHAYLYSKGMLS